MRTICVRVSMAAALMASIAMMGVSAAPASATLSEEGTICTGNSGTIKLSPGLEGEAHVQNITIKGELTGCAGSMASKEAKYVAHLKTTNAVSCAALGSAGEAATGTIVIKWAAPKGQGNSHGTISLPLTESGVSMTGKLASSGPFENLGIYDPVSQAFTGACGVVETGKKKAKKVKNGTLTGSTIAVARGPTSLSPLGEQSFAAV